MLAELEREAALEPDRLTFAVAVELPVLSERGDRLLAELQLVGGVAEAVAPPCDLEQVHQVLERAAALRVEALEHLVDGDAEALVDRRLLRDPEDARELVLERAQPVGLDVRGREHQPVAAARDEA